MSTAITRAFEHWNAEQVMNGLPARPDTIIFAHVSGLDPNAEIDRDAGLPGREQIVYQAPVAQFGLVNENAVAYSVVLDTFIGDFDFNYLALVHAESNTVCMVVHTMTQNKIATANGKQGNSFTRTFLMEFNGAAESSQITVTAETWQIDYGARLKGIDESVRLSNIDYYGQAAFIGNGFKVTKNGSQYRIASGVGYVGGLRVTLSEDRLIEESLDKSVWVDVALKGTVTGAHTPDVRILLADELVDYVDSAGFSHYVAKLAIEDNAVIEDVRPATPQEHMVSALDEHEKSRNHPDATLSKPGFAVLSNATNSEAENKAATPKAVKLTYDLADSKAETVNGKGIDADKNIALSAADVDSVSASEGGQFRKPIAAAYHGPYGYANQYESDAPYFNEFITTASSEYHPLIKQRSTIDKVSSYAFSQGVIIANGTQAWNLHIRGSGTHDKVFTWNIDGDFTAPRNIWCSGNICSGSSYMRNDGNIIGSIYGGGLTDWVYRYFVQSIRRGSQQYVRPADWTVTYEVPDGYITGFNNSTNDGNLRFCGWYFRVPMFLINGSWVNAGNY